jgi:hypothetical protein
LKSLERYAVATEEQFTLCLERYCNDPGARMSSAAHCEAIGDAVASQFKGSLIGAEKEL